jgi:nitrogen PTS system EIIA component
MNIKSFLSPADVIIGVEARDKSTLLKSLSTRAADALDLAADAVTNQIERRDELGSTGIGGGVCIPHARLREVKKPFGLLARLREPIDFEAIDGQPIDIIFLLLLPAAFQLEQLNALAAVARKLRDPEVLRKLREAPSATALYDAVAT